MASASPDNVFVDDIIVPAVDGFALAGTLFLPRGRKHHTVLISSATGAPRRLYHDFSAYLASRGCVALTFDYRGTGGSRRSVISDAKRCKSLSGFQATMADWALRDASAAVAWLRGHYKDLPLAYVGHGFGGHALGLLPNNGDVSRALLIASQAGYWRHARGPERYRLYALMNYYGKPVTRVFGYLPGGLGFGADVPKGVFDQWSDWASRPRFMFDDASLAALGNFQNYIGALRAMCFSDDNLATRSAVQLLCREFTATRAQVIEIAPGDVGVSKIGHLGFFANGLRETLWRGAAEWLETKAPPVMMAQPAYPAAARA